MMKLSTERSSATKKLLRWVDARVGVVDLLDGEKVSG